MGSWIGGDRDGNPFVVADTLRYAIARRPASRSRTTSTRCTRSARELSLSARLVTPTPELLALAASAHDANPHRARRAVPAGADRHLRAARGDRRGDSPATRRRARRTRSLPPYRGARRSCSPISTTIAASLASHGAQLLADGRLVAAARARSRCSASIWPCSTCARTPTCTRRSSPSCSRAPACTPTTRRCPRTSASRCSRASSRVRACSHTPHLGALGAARVRARDPARRGRHPSPLRLRRAAQLRDLEVPVGVSDLLEVGDPAEGSRPADARAALAVNIVPLFETIDDLAALRRDHARGVPRCRATGAWLDGARPRAGSDARLLGQQQGRRLRHRELGALPRRAGAGRGVPRARRSSCASSTGAAARSGAAAGRATRRSSRSRRAASTAVCASPSRARSSRASTPIRSSAGAISRRWSRRRSRRASCRARARAATRRIITRVMDELAAHAHRAYRALVYDTPEFVAVLSRRDADRGNRRAQHRQPAGVAQRRRRASRTCARFRGCSAGANAG